jgi:cytochrome c
MTHKPDLNSNTIFMAILTAGVVGMLAGFASRQIVTPEFVHEDAFAIEVTENTGAGGGAVEAKAEPILALLAAADVAKGESLSKQCAACHDFTKGGADRVGPNLWGVIGGAKAHRSSFAYSDDLKAKGGSWTYDDLNHFLWKPKSFIAGTKMNFIGIKKPEDRAALIAWLRAQSDSPAALPTDAEIANEAPAEETAETSTEMAEDATTEAVSDAKKSDETGTGDAATDKQSAPAKPEATASTPAPVEPAKTGVMPVAPDKK